MSIISFLYHDVITPGQFESSGFQGADANIYKLNCDTFEQHLTTILKHSELTSGLVHEALAGDDQFVLFTFDDGGSSAYHHIAAILEKYGVFGHFFVTTDYIGTPGFLTEDEIQALRRRGHLIGSHSCSHPARISYCSPSELDKEWENSIKKLEAILGEKIEIASVPGGYYSKEVALSAAKAGITVLFNSEPETNQSDVKGCIVLGRFSVQQGDSAKHVSSLVSGRKWLRLKAYVFWNCKKALKYLGGSYWLGFRKLFLKKRANNL